ncbi:hypothetical protein ACFUTV_40110 [Streptomyces sp. NPDC057298]|uniref:hypothetical protein n=1 Tax=Streptomyces sp. NPDC057298 TaxID=3346091 RepID=UPI0036339229
MQEALPSCPDHKKITRLSRHTRTHAHHDRHDTALSGKDAVQPRQVARGRYSLMASWILAVLFVSFGLAFVRVQKGRRLLGRLKASTATGTLCYLLGWLQAFFTFPSHACPDFFDRRPIVHFDRHESSVFPPQATCYWDDGEQKELVSSWVNPLLFTCVVVLTGCLVTLAVTSYCRYRQRHTS